MGPISTMAGMPETNIYTVMSTTDKMATIPQTKKIAFITASIHFFDSHEASSKRPASIADRVSGFFVED